MSIFIGRENELQMFRDKLQSELNYGVPFAKFRSASSRNRFILNLEPTASRRSVLAAEFRSLEPNEQILVGHLLWHMLFGKRFKSAHWYFLFRLFEKTLKNNEPEVNALLYGCLLLSTPRKRVNRLDINHKAIGFTLKGFKVNRSLNFQSTERPTMLDLIVSRFHIPRKALPLEELVYWFPREIKQRKPIEPKRIGVGYKDQGSMNAGPGYEPEIPAWDPSIDVDLWITLKQLWNYMISPI